MFNFFFWNFLLLIGTLVIAFFWLLDSVVSAVFSFILIYLLVSMFFFFLNIEFLGLLLLMIYIGGIMILFVFIAITLGGRIATTAATTHSTFIRFLISILGVKIYFLCDFLDVWLIDLSFKTWLNETSLFHNYLYKYTDIYIFSTLLYTEFASLVILLGFILLWALIGSITLAKAK